MSAYSLTLPDIEQSAALSAEERNSLWASLTGLQQQWFLHFVSNGFNATAAAREAGYEAQNPGSLRVIGYENRRHAAIVRLLADTFRHRIMTADEALAQETEVAETSACDFITFKPVVERRMVLRPVRELLAELEAEIDFEREYARLAELSAAEKEAHDDQLRRMERQAIRYRLRLVRDLDAAEEALGPPVEVHEPDVDLEKAAQLGRMGVVKEITRDKKGRLGVVLYDKHQARRTLLEASGRLKGPEDAKGNTYQQTNNYWTVITSKYSGKKTETE